MQYLTILTLSTAVSSTIAHSAVVNYSESVDGLLSSNTSLPTDIGIFDIGNNTVSGTINESGFGENGDVFTFQISEGQVLTSVTLVISESTITDVQFLGAHDSTGMFRFLETPKLLFASLISSEDNGDNLLIEGANGGNAAQSVNAPPTRGFDLPLQAEEYTFWLQETANETLDYSFTFTVSTIPEPGSTLLLSLASISLLSRRVRR